MSICLPKGGIVRGVGTDLVECERIRLAMERHGERFLQRVYTADELSYCMAMKNPVPSLAARFAAKEAVSKCFSTGIGGELGWLSIEVHKGVREEPLVRLDSAGLRLLEETGCSSVLISLSHTRNYGLAYAVLLSTDCAIS